VIEQRLRDASSAWFPPTPSVSAQVRRRLPAAPDQSRLQGPHRLALVVAAVALALAGTALAASWLELVPGVRIQRVPQLPELAYAYESFGTETSVAQVERMVRFELVLPGELGPPDRVVLDRDRAGAPVVTALYGGDYSARLVLTQWPATAVLFDKLLRRDTPFDYVDVHGAPGIWLEGGDHAVFYRGSAAHEGRVGGYVTGNVLVWHRGSISYRLELGGTLEDALDLAGSLRPPR
jgi:hypothetical protein